MLLIIHSRLGNKTNILYTPTYCFVDDGPLIAETIKETKIFVEVLIQAAAEYDSYINCKNK